VAQAQAQALPALPPSAARAYDTYVKDGVVYDRSSRFKGVSWIKSRGKWHSRQGLTLVHFSAQPEPLLTQNTP